MSQSGTAPSELSADPLSRASRLLDQGQLSAAATLLQQVLRVQPNHAESLHRLGVIANRLGMPDRSIRLLRHALRAGGESPELLNDLGRVFVDVGDLDNADRCFQRCIDCYPRSILGYVSSACLENLAGHFERAEELYLAAISNADQPFEAEFNLATMYREWGHLTKASKLYNALLERHPDTPLLAEGRARALLQQRAWRDGWTAYESRLLIEEEPARVNLEVAVSRWNGQSLRGKRILVLYEQGIGDEVQFASCYADVISQAEQCTITCSPRLLPIFARSFPQATFLPVSAEERETWRPDDASLFDFFVPAGSLPRYTRNHDNDFPGTPFLIASRSAPQNAQQRRARPRVGVSWWGGAVPDQIQKRSIPFHTFQRLFDVSEVEFVNLQHGCCDQESRTKLSQFRNLHTPEIDPYHELEPWFDLLASLDLLISVDNSNIHFAGAVGVPAWLLLPDHPNWRWPAGFEFSQWYASVKLIRKRPREDWGLVIAEVSKRLRRSYPGITRRTAA